MRWIEKLAGGVWDVLSLADEKFTAWHQRKRDEIRVVEAIQEEHDWEAASREEARERVTAAIQAVRRRSRARQVATMPAAVLLPPRPKTAAAIGIWREANS